MRLHPSGKTIWIGCSDGKIHIRDVREFLNVSVIEPVGKAKGRAVLDICLEDTTCAFSYKHAGIFVYSELEESDNYDSSD